MNLELGILIIAFLAARCPGAYTSEAVCARINDSGMLDARASDDETQSALRILLKNGWVQSDIEPAGTRIYWSATPSGVKTWHASGRLHVGR